ncbi:MAG: diguanylate cyclase [Pelosinus sp.]|nr:diguanylate cyclase [Pelosinus sp.]
MRNFKHIKKSKLQIHKLNIKSNMSPLVNSVVQSVGFGVFIIDADTHQIVYANPMALKLSKYKQRDIFGHVCHKIVCPTEVGKCPITDFGKKVDNSERVLIRADGTALPIIKTVVPMRLAERCYLIESFVDYSERKDLADKLTFISFHDTLTGLLNREAFERYITKLADCQDTSIGIIMCDADGLKTVNDTIGHDAGDYMLKKIASLLSAAANKEMVARIGGDEFVVIINNSNQVKIKTILDKMQTLLAEHNGSSNIEISLSMGYAYNLTGENADIHQLIKTADKNMYKEKLLHRHSAKSAIVSTLSNVLAERDQVTGGHADRIIGMAAVMGQKLLLQAGKIANLKLLAQFHDIGKIAVPDAVLGKPGALTDEEREVMRKHCQIGFRIANSANVFSEINELILLHHEWWNGEGYPLGLKGEAIPLECRIVSIVDAYDAMTSDRPYRKAMPRAAAIKELRDGAGSQFDPVLVDIFIKLIEQDQ